MIRLLEVLIAVVIVAVLFVVVGLFLPGHRFVDHELETNRPVRQVFDTLNSFRRFKDWHPLRARDPNIQYTLEGPSKGVGARLVYDSTNPQIGHGSLEIIDAVQDEKVVIRASNEAYGEDKIHTFTLEPKARTVKIDWSYDVDYGWNLLGRYAGLYINRTVGDDIRIGLGNLVGLLATMPNFDYKTLEISYTQVEPVHELFESMKTERNITAVENGMDQALTDIRKAIAANKLEEAGPPRLITTNFGSEKYEFDVAIPVSTPEGWTPPPAAKQAKPAAQPADAGNEGEDAVAEGDPSAQPAAPVETPALPPIEGLNLPENVQQGVGYGGPALLAVYQGHPAALPLVRDMLRAYAASHGDIIHDRAFEEYLNPLDAAVEEATFNVYWPIETDAAQAELFGQPADGGMGSDEAGAALPAGDGATDGAMPADGDATDAATPDQAPADAAPAEAEPAH